MTQETFDDLSWMGQDTTDFKRVLATYPCQIGSRHVPLSDPNGQTCWNGYWPPTLSAVEFCLHTDERTHRGETVDLVITSKGMETVLPAFLEIVDNQRKVYAYRQVKSWQLREDDRGASGTQLLEIERAPYQEAPPDYDPRTIPQIDPTCALIPLARVDGSFRYDGCHPPHGLEPVLFITHDNTWHRGRTAFLRAGREQRMAVVFMASSKPMIDSRDLKLYFPEEVALWQAAHPE